MDTLNSIVIPLSELPQIDISLIGGKAAKLAELKEKGFQVPEGFCVSAEAYSHFIEFNSIDKKVTFELGRKPLENMRWEEVWDAALRIRSAFGRGVIPPEIKEPIINALGKLGSHKLLAVRSSSPKEDSQSASFAGMHESYVNVKGSHGLLDAVKKVWASLWSDAALLYQKELKLDPINSTMAVLVQELVEEPVSGVAFGQDPAKPESDNLLIEAVPGLCSNLVDGEIEPDRWLLEGRDGTIVENHVGMRKDEQSSDPLLDIHDLRIIFSSLRKIEALYGWKPDMEWTGQKDRFTLLQTRPITSLSSTDEQKSYYLTLRPDEKRLQKLAKKVGQELIPRLENEGERLAEEELDSLDDISLAEAVDRRKSSLEKWREIYKSDFIPFAHGVRQLATYYNDAVRPKDPYEFIGLLKGLDMRAGRRNSELRRLAAMLAAKPSVQEYVRCSILQGRDHGGDSVPPGKHEPDRESIKQFHADFNGFLRNHMDVSFDGKRMKNQSVIMLQNILVMAKKISGDTIPAQEDESEDLVKHLEKKLFNAVAATEKKKAKNILDIGRLSWKLRDDDNLLLGRIESQLIRAVNEGALRLRKNGRLADEGAIKIIHADLISDALRRPEGGAVALPAEHHDTGPISSGKGKARPRQLPGQPASPGLISGKVRKITNVKQIGAFQDGEILVCDAIQPNMTHLVPLAGAIIERRGGMLIHGAIIARELGIPCVNGIADAVDILQDGETVTVDGHLGIVTVGAAEFDLELSLKVPG